MCFCGVRSGWISGVGLGRDLVLVCCGDCSVWSCGECGGYNVDGCWRVWVFVGVSELSVGRWVCMGDGRWKVGGFVELVGFWIVLLVELVVGFVGWEFRVWCWGVGVIGYVGVWFECSIGVCGCWGMVLLLVWGSRV